MAFNFPNLDAETRNLMIAEIDGDIAAGRIHISNRLSADGQEVWCDLLKDAAQNHDEEWLAAELRRGNRFNATETRNLNGKVISAKVPITAADTLAQGEFNRFYIRAVCLRAKALTQELVEIYRAKAVANPRVESEAKIGHQLNPDGLLNDLRANVGFDAVLGLPPGPNSGLSVRL